MLLVALSRYPSSVEVMVDEAAIFHPASETRAKFAHRFPVSVFDIAPVRAEATRAFVK